MASINGISVKNLTQFTGHEGETLYQGNLYLNRKKLGFWSQDGWGGPDQYTFEGEYDGKLLKQAVVDRNRDKAIKGGTPDDPYVVDYDLDILLYDYLKLAEDEKMYKKAVKKGYDGILVATDGYHMAAWNLPEAYTALSDEDLLNRMQAAIAKEKASFLKEDKYTQHTIKIYRAQKDFCIGEPIPLDEITKKKTLNQSICNAEKDAASRSKESTAPTEDHHPER